MPLDGPRLPTETVAWETAPVVPGSAILLTETLKLLDNGQHWIKRHTQRGGDYYCMMGALQEVYWKSHCRRRDYRRAKRYLRAAVRENTYIDRHWIMGFNDSPGTRWRHVQTAIERATEIAITTEIRQ